MPVHFLGREGLIKLRTLGMTNDCRYDPPHFLYVIRIS